MNWVTIGIAIYQLIQKKKAGEDITISDLAFVPDKYINKISWIELIKDLDLDDFADKLSDGTKALLKK